MIIDMTVGKQLISRSIEMYVILKNEQWRVPVYRKLSPVIQCVDSFLRRNIIFIMDFQDSSTHTHMRCPNSRISRNKWADLIFFPTVALLHL